MQSVWMMSMTRYTAYPLPIASCSDILLAMNILSALYTLIISPIETIIEAVFCFELTIVGFLGAAGAIITVSLAVGFLALPIYNVADAIQKKERDTQAEMAQGIKRIKETFTGDERFMMMQTFYREHHWSPVYALRSSLSILIEIPFFIAAYHFLSHCSALQGVGFGPIADLGAPDSLIALGGLHLNLLPILMTAINAVSSAVYLKGFTLREKAQTYCLALIFLVLLYNSPAGLVFYWTLNNLFSLAKNVVQRWVKRPGWFVHIVITAMMLFAGVYIILFGDIHNRIYRAAAIALPLLVGVVPVMVKVWQRGRSLSAPLSGWLSLSKPSKRPSSQAGKNRNDGNSRLRHSSPSLSLLVFSCLALALLCGLVLPADAVGTSPIEFSFIGNTASPLYYVQRDLCLALGMCVLWPLVLYKMFGGNRYVRVDAPLLAAAVLMCALLNVKVFAFDYGMMDVYFKLDDAKCLKNYSAFYTVLPLVAAAVAAAVLFALHRFKVLHHLGLLAMAVCAAEAVYAGVKMSAIHGKYKNYAEMNPSLAVGTSDKIEPIYHLSKNGRNVIVIFLDGGISSFFPKVLEEMPQLRSSFDGFTYYPNTLSFGAFTLLGSPAMMGGYDYTPDAMNERPDELLRDKHNEALLVMPRLFNEAGWHATLTDPPFSNYAWSGDATPFALYPDTECKFVNKSYYPQYIKHMKDTGNAAFPNPDLITAKHSAAFCAMQAMPPILRSAMYDTGMYLELESQNRCVAQYAHLFFMPQLTDTASDKDSFIFFDNDLTHEAAILQQPGYVPVVKSEGKPTTGTYKSKTENDVEFYHVNAAAFMLVARYLDYLRTQGVYNNSRIIIVADHGKGITSPNPQNMAPHQMAFNPLLMVKDFGEESPLHTDNTFMTNADTVMLATHGITSDTNPFTGRPLAINKTKMRVYDAGATTHLRNAGMKELKTWQLKGSHAWLVRDDISKEENWEELDTEGL